MVQKPYITIFNAGAKQMTKWTLNISQYAKKKQAKILDVKRQIAFELLSSIVQKTPVDTGRARGNWTVSINTKDETVSDACDKSGGETISKGKDKIDTVEGDEAIYIQNNLPYIRTLEYGVYPNPPKKGTWNPREKEYEIRSVNGFSKQAPKGMVGLAVMEAQQIIDEAVK